MFCDVNGIMLEINNKNKVRKIHKCFGIKQ